MITMPPQTGTFVIRVRAQLLFPLNGIIRSLWKYQYAPAIHRYHDNRKFDKTVTIGATTTSTSISETTSPINTLTTTADTTIGRDIIVDRLVLLDHTYHRINAHEGVIEYRYRVYSKQTTSVSTMIREEQKNDDTLSPLDNNWCKTRSLYGIRFNNMHLYAIEQQHLSEYLRKKSCRRERRLQCLQQVIATNLNHSSSNRQHLQQKQNQRYPTTDPPYHNESIIFWKSNTWWYKRILLHKHTRGHRVSDHSTYGNNSSCTSHQPIIVTATSSLPWWESILHTLSISAHTNIIINNECRRTIRMLNHLVRQLLACHHTNDIEEAVDMLLSASNEEYDLLNKLYVEPPSASLFAAYLSTTFMHHKQQQELNTKHAAAKGDQARSSENVQSERNFDPKIYLDMCSSCDKKDIFELMLSLDRTHHQQIPCQCTFCAKLRETANAWRYYDCRDRVWLRLEFNRRFYHGTSVLLQQEMTKSLVENDNDRSTSATTSVPTPNPIDTRAKQSMTTVRIVYLSYKNEFTDRARFLANFVNYYAFYENAERPVSRDNCHGELREKISIIFIFALVNWRLIEQTKKRGATYNSISLNQQSIFKSIDNTLYAIFSENSINRMCKETKQRILNINAPYVNRGFGALPNNGINAITTTITGA